MIAVKIDAGHDVNGNPRRGWMVIDTGTGSLVDFIDEGFEGTGALRRDWPDAVMGPQVKVPPSEYRELKKFSREVRSQR